MKRLLTGIAFLCSMDMYAANSLLQNPATGTVTISGTQDPSLTIIANNTDAALVLGMTGAVYVIDIQDANTAEATANTITSIPDFVASKLNAAAGATVSVIDMAVNPRSKSVYVLGRVNGNQYRLFKVKSNGASVTQLSLDNVTYSKINLAASGYASAVTWGNNTLYVCGTSTSGTSLAAELNWMAAPFAHNGTFTKRMTSMFKSNWGNTYMTDAPLERMAYGTVAGKNRLMGVTTCAPGYSLDIASLTGSGVLQVTEDFNVNTGSSSKVVAMIHDGKSWLYDLHDGSRLYRIGEKYLDGSQVTANQYNAGAKELRDFMGNIATGLTDNEFKYISDARSIAFWDNGKMLILDPPGTNNGALHLVTMGVAPGNTGITENIRSNDFALQLFPNPARETLNISLPQSTSCATITVYSLDGKQVLAQTIKGAKAVLDIHQLPAGTYSLTAVLQDGKKTDSRFIIK